MSYSPFFQTLHDESLPTGHFGRGTHYSVLRAPIWQDEWLNPLSQGGLLDFAIIWDEDHDDRVIEAIEEMYFGGLLSPVRFIGERKGTLSVLIEEQKIEAWNEKALRNYRAAVGHIGGHLDDPWPTTVEPIPGRASAIIHGAPEDVATYLNNIQLLWQLGRYPNLVHLQAARQKRLDLTFPEQKMALQEPNDETPF